MVQYRRRKSFGPLRFTVSQRGISTSIGEGPMRLSYGADGKVRRTVRAPGLGVWDTKVIGGAAHPAPRSAKPASVGKPITLLALLLALVAMLAGAGLLLWLFLSAGLWPLGVGMIGGMLAWVVIRARRR